MKRILIALMLISITSISFAYSYFDDDTHWVKDYTRSDGTHVQGHRSGNPGSGVHCHDGFCSYY